MRLLLLLLLSLLSFPLSAQSKIEAEELQEDFLELREKLVKYNPGLYEFIQKDALENHWNTISSQLTKPMSELEFSQVEEKIKLFPFYVFINEADEAYILRNASADSTIYLGGQLMSINDQSITSIKEQIFDNIIADEAVETWKYFETNARFNRLYYRFVDTTSTFSIDYKNEEGNLVSKEVKAVTNTTYADSVNVQNKRLYELDKALSAIHTTYHDSLSTGVLRIKSFNKGKLKAGDSKFKRDVKEFFEKANSENYENVVIDLRGNTGGRIRYLAYLLTFIQNNDEEIPIFKRTYFKWLSRSKLKENEAKTNKRNKKPFEGEVYILTDGGSYSASVMLASFARELADATIVGEPTGGRYNGTSAGSFRVVRLKNSNLTVRIPEVLFSYYVTEQPNGSLIPDIIIPKKVEDFFSRDADHQLNTLLESIQQNQVGK